MTVVGLHWTPFRIPFRRPFATAHGARTTREGLIVRVRLDGGAVGLGEASPLPEFGGGSAGIVAALLADVAPRLLGRDGEAALATLDALPAPRPGGSAFRCALEVALLDAAGRRAKAPVARLLRAGGAAPLESVPVNATIGAAALPEAQEAATRARAEGYPAVKLKVGLAARLDDERARVAAVRAAIGPAVALRLDANGAWGVVQAIAAVRALAAFDLEWVEQPTPPADLDGLAAVQRATETPIAADESLASRGSAQAILARRAARVLVLKPMVLGGLRPALAIAGEARQRGVRTVVTTTLDSGVATAAALHLAAALPANTPACGLATAPLLESDLLARSLPVQRGSMRLPVRDGLGVELDENELERWRHGADGTAGTPLG